VALTRDNCGEPARLRAGGRHALALGDQTRGVIRLFDLPVREGLFVPGEDGAPHTSRSSSSSGLAGPPRGRRGRRPGLGMPRSVAAMFRGSAFDVDQGSARRR
jgi:hypothetical protein